MVHLGVMGEAVIQAPQGRVTPSATRVFSLALLLLLDREHPWERDELVSLIWPDASISNGRHNLRQALYRLRSVGVPVWASGERIVLDPAVTVRNDEPTLHESTEELSDAIVAGTRRIGHFLGGYDPTYSPALREWIEDRRSQSHARVRVVLARCLEHGRRSARWSEVERLATMLVQFDPLNEAGTLARAEVALLTGDKVGAVSMLKRYEDEVGCINRDIAIPAQILRSRVSERTDFFGSSSQSGTSRLLGREAETQLFFRFLGTVRSGRARSLTLVGRPGSGRSRLLEAYRAIGRTLGFVDTVVRFDKRDALKPCSSAISIAAALLELPGALAIAPESLALLTRLTTGEAPSLSGADTEHEIGSALGELIESVAVEAPLLLMIDDADYVDVRSLDALRHATSQLSEATIAFVLATRRDTRISEVVAEDTTTRVTAELQPLDSKAAHEMARSLLGESAPTEAIEWVAESSGGNPLHISVLATHWEVTRTYTTPLTIAETLRLALAERSDQALHLLHLVGAARLCRSIACLQHMTGHSLNTLYSLLRELENASLLEVRGHSIVLTYPLIAEAVAALNGQAANAVAHRTIALHLDSEHADSIPHQDVWERAYHWLAAGDLNHASAAVKYCLRDLWRAGLPRETAQMAASLLTLCTSPQERIRIGHALITALDEGANWTDLQSLARWLPVAEDDATSEGWAQIATIFSEFRLSGDADAALRALRPYVTSIHIPPATRVRAADHALRIADINMDRATIKSTFEMVSTLFADASVPKKSALICHSVFHSTVGSLTEAVTAAGELVEEARSSADPASLSRALRFRSLVHGRNSDIEAARLDLEEALDLVRQADAQAVVSIVASRLLELAIDLADIEDAQRWFELMERTISVSATDTMSIRAHGVLRCRYELSRTDDPLPSNLRDSISLLPQQPRRERMQILAIQLQDALRRCDTRAVSRLTRALQQLWGECDPDCGVDYAASVMVRGLNSVRGPEVARSFLTEFISRRREPGPINKGLQDILPESLRLEYEVNRR